MYLADKVWQWLWEHHGLQQRPTQIALAQEIRKTLQYPQPSIGLYECPTGAGKSLAQLIEGLAAARESGQPVWIATPRRDLQAQLIRDADLVTQATRALSLPTPTIIKLQGLEHTLCHLLVQHQDHNLQQTITTWLQSHPDGNLDDLPNTIPRNAVSMATTNCPKERCQWYSTCLSHQARLQANAHELIITNHALIASTTRRPFLPAPQTLIIDEGHLFDRAIRQTLTFSVSLHEIERHAQAFLKTLPHTKGQRITQAQNTLVTLLHGLRTTHLNLTDAIPKKSGTILPLFGYKIIPHPLAAKVLANAGQLLGLLRNVLKALTPLSNDSHISLDKLDIAKQELSQAEQNLEAFCTGNLDQYFLTRTESHSLGFLRIPDRVDHYARKRLWNTLQHTVLLSGTLATSNADPFSAIRGNLGIPGDSAQTKHITPSSHTLFEQVFLPSWTPSLHLNLVPSTFPSVFISKKTEDQEVETHGTEDDVQINPEWIDQACQLILQQDKRQEQGIVVLSTNYTMQQVLVAQLRDHLTRPMIVQEQHHMAAATRHYLAQGPHTIFFTVAGWEGMDLPNAYIQDLVILKLPYPVKAKTAMPRFLEQPLTLTNTKPPKHSLDAKHYYIQIQRTAIIAFRQAIGRVIRTPMDSGTIWVTDRRLAEPGTQSLFFGGPSRRYLYTSTTITTLPPTFNTEAA